MNKPSFTLKFTEQQESEIAEFIKRTDYADRCCAMRYLQENDWDTEAALCAYDADE